MNITRRCHYLPQFYLDNFTDENCKLYIYDKSDPEKKPRIQTPINTCIEKDLYNLKKEDGTIDDSMERLILAPMEGEASSVIKEIVNNDKKLSDDIIVKIALFIAFMLTRVPKSIEAAMELSRAIQIHHLKELSNNPEEIQKFLDRAQKEGKEYKGITVEKLQDDIQNFEDRYSIEMNKTFATGLSLQPTFELFRLLLEMNWCLCRAPKDSYFITSDSPAVIFVQQRDGSAMFGGGLALENAEVTFPLSTEKCIYIDRRHSQKYRALSKAFLKEINKRTAWSANKIIISNKELKYLFDLNQETSESLKYPKIDAEWMIEHYKSLKKT